MTPKALLLLAGAVLLSWLMIWVVMPTNAYRNTWLPKLRAATDSTYFGRQGATLLIYTFPILLIAILGCIYLHLVKRDGNIHSGKLSNSGFVAWERPAMVDWPLGIVSRIELCFLLMSLALLIWFFASYLRLDFANIKLDDGEKLWQYMLKKTALRFGLVGDLCCAFLFFPIARGSSLLPLLGLTSENTVKYHVWLGHIVMVVLSAHGICFVIFWVSTNQIDEMFMWPKTGIANVAGEIALLAGLIMWAMAIPRIRRKTFELFFYTHQLYIVFILFYLLHVGIAHFCMVLPGVFLFAVDRYLRFLLLRPDLIKIEKENPILNQIEI